MKNKTVARFACGVLAASMFVIGAAAQNLPPMTSSTQNGQLDPTQGITDPVMESSLHKPLPEEYIWTADAAENGTRMIITLDSAGHYELGSK